MSGRPVLCSRLVHSARRYTKVAAAAAAPGGAGTVRPAARGRRKGIMAEPIPAQKSPYAVEVEAGRKYFWCACGRSAEAALLRRLPQGHRPRARGLRGDGDQHRYGSAAASRRSRSRCATAPIMHFRPSAPAVHDRAIALRLALLAAPLLLGACETLNSIGFNAPAGAAAALSARRRRSTTPAA